jgi:serine/threonine protein kinase
MIIQHLFSAVKYMHKNGYVHRNLRPETIMFETENGHGDIKIVDFISAIPTSSMSEEDTIFETFIKSDPHYRCPELLGMSKKK